MRENKRQGTLTMSKAGIGWLVAGAVLFASSIGYAQDRPTYYKTGEADHCSLARDLDVATNDAACARSTSGVPVNTRGLSDPTQPVVAKGNGAAIQFGFDSATLTPEARHDLDALAKAIKSDNTGRSFAIDGHTDAVGGDAYNDGLSKRRAVAVVEYLSLHHGIDPSRLTARGFGKSKPYDPTKPEDSINRRVEVHGSK